MESNNLSKEQWGIFSIFMEFVKSNYMNMLNSIVSAYVGEKEVKERLEEVIEHISLEFQDGHYEEDGPLKKWIFYTAHGYMMSKYLPAAEPDKEQISPDASAIEVLKILASMPRFRTICRILKQQLELEGFMDAY